jgi:hypothetical protein
MKLSAGGPPRLAQPRQVRLEAAGGDHQGPRADRQALAAAHHRDRLEAPAGKRQVHHLGLVGDLDPERLGGAVIGIISALPPPRKNALVRARWSVPPSGAWKRTPCCFIHGTWRSVSRIVMRARRSSVRPAGDLEQVLPVLFLGIGAR